MPARILSISFSPIHRDARVLRQLDVLAQHGAVTTVGYGPAPDHVAEHLELDSRKRSLPQTPSGVARLAARQWHRSEMVAPGLVQAAGLLQDRSFDLVVANEARALPLAHRVARGTPVWADMHEWAPEERSHVRSWRLLVGPLMDHVCREYLPRAAAVTTVNRTLADKYAEVYAVRCEVVRNARPFIDLEPAPLPEDGMIRLVHSGGAEPGRNIEMLIDACRAVPSTTLGLVLVPAGDGGRFLRELRARAQGCARITFHDPVPPAELPSLLNTFDVGVYSLPPANVNMEFALPNKVFDFVQGRLGLVVGPSPEMGRLVTDYGLGVVAADFELDSFVAALRSLTPAGVAAYKAAAHCHAKELSSDADVETSHRIVERLLGC